MLSKKTKYALHALTYLAKNKDKSPHLIVDIAEKTKSPRKFLENILLELKKIGYLGSKMGKGGGYYLIKPADEIKFSIIIRHFDGPIAYVPCASLNYYEQCEECEDETSCGLHKVMLKLRDETLEMLEGKTIQDVVDQENFLNH